MNNGLFVVLSLIVATSVCDTINQLFLKSTIDSFEALETNSVGKILKFILRLIMTPRVWIGCLFAILSLCIWLVVLSKADLNFAFSLDSMHYIFIALASQYILKEKVGPRRWLGTLFIVIGIFLVSLS